MRNEQEMMTLFVDFAMNDERIRLVTLEGSRTNRNISPDTFQDYDIPYFVTDIDSFKENDQWLNIFGNRLMMQKPEDMELFPVCCRPFPRELRGRIFENDGLADWLRARLCLQHREEL